MLSIGIAFKHDEMVLVALKQGVTEYRLEGYRILPFLDLKGEEREQSILHNLERFVQSYKAARNNIFIALPRDLALVQFLQIPAAAEENLQATLGFEIDRYTPFGFDDVYFDWHVTAHLPESGLITVLLVTIKRSIVDYYLGLFAKLDIRPQAIEITTTALCNAFAKYQNALDRVQNPEWMAESGLLSGRTLEYIEKVSPRAARYFKKVKPQEPELAGVDILAEFLDGARCEMAIFNRRSLCHSQVVGLPEAGGAGAMEQLQELHDAGARALIYMPVTGQQETLPVRMHLSGREMQRDFLDGVPESLASSLSVSRRLPVELGKFSEESIAGSMPVLFMPAAVALRGLRSTPLDINLIPAPQRPKRKKSKRKLVAGAVLVVLLGLLSSYFMSRNIAMKEQLAGLSSEVNGLRKQVQQIEDQQQESSRRERFIAAMKNIRENDKSKLRILEELTRLIPDDSWLSEFNYKSDEKKVRISGFAVSAAKLIPLLEDSALFENVKFSTVITNDPRSGKERFRIEMNVTGTGGVGKQ